MGEEMTAQQKAARELIKCDLRYLYTILQNRDTNRSHKNYTIGLEKYCISSYLPNN